MINIKFTTMSPLAQIDKSEAASLIKNSTIKVKTQKTFVENSSGAKKILFTPIYTGNGYRGMLRRETMAVMLEALAKNTKDGEKLIASPEDYHLVNAGGGNLYQSQPHDVEKKVRLLNPQISLFGASLAIEGKLKVANFIPYEELDNGEYGHVFTENSEGKVYSSILANSTIIVKDGILDGDKNSQYLTREQITQWINSTSENAKARASARNSEDKKDEKVKKTSMRGAVDREYVAVGVDFFGSITVKAELTNIEKGLLLKGLERSILNNLGSTSSNDFGKVEYIIEIEEESILETSVDKYGKCIISNKKYSSEVDKYINETDEFLKNITTENFAITNILVKK